MKFLHDNKNLIADIVLFTFFYTIVLLIFAHFFPAFSTINILILIAVFFIILLLFVSYEKEKISNFLKEKDTYANLNRILYHLLYKSVNANDKEELYQLILDSAIEAIPNAEKGAIMMLEEESGLFRYVAAAGYDFTSLKNTFLRLEQSYLYHGSKGNIQHTVRIHDPLDYDCNNTQEENIRIALDAGTKNIMSTISTPIFYNNQIRGIINIDSSRVNAFPASDCATIELFAMEIVNVLEIFNSKEYLTYVSTHDTLTKTYNRTYFREIAPKLLDDFRKNQGSLTLVAIDLNDFKQSNDHYGHDCGDSFLVHFASLVQKQLSEESYFFRLGGDEFILLLPNFSRENTKKLMHELASSLEKNPLIYEQHTIRLSFSYGSAKFPDECNDIDTLVRLADKRMYRGKREYHAEEALHG